jgi:hypothetical protein
MLSFLKKIMLILFISFSLLLSLPDKNLTLNDIKNLGYLDHLDKLNSANN